MSDDGADLNFPADQALTAVMGGKEEPEQLSEEAFEAMIRSAEGRADGQWAGYGNTANIAARRILEFLEAHPEHRETPIEAEGGFRYPDGTPFAWTSAEDPLPDEVQYVKVREGLYDAMKAAGVDLSDLGLTGFQWGWAANAARHILGLDAQPNPAILEVSV